MRGKTKTCSISELPSLSLHSAVSPVSISLMVFVIFPFVVVVVWVCQMGFSLKFLTPMWEDPNAHYNMWLGRKAHGTTMLAAHQFLASTPHTAPKAAPGHCCERQPRPARTTGWHRGPRQPREMSRFSQLQNRITCSGRPATRHQLCWDAAQRCHAGYSLLTLLCGAKTQACPKQPLCTYLSGTQVI